jgi:amino acid transporter
LLGFGISVLASGGGPEGLNLSASFSPAAVAAGAPGVAIMFAVASMFGFESTAIYSDEAKDPRRTVARATYLSVSVIAVFFAFMTWMLVSYYGPSSVTAAAEAAVGSGDATSFFFTAAVDKLGLWAGAVGGALLITSVLAGIIAFHNAINRYLHSLAQRGSVPASLARTNPHGAPYAAAYVQTAMALVMTMPFAILGMDPVLTLFAWFSGVAVVALLVLYVLASAAIVVFFRRHGGQGVWQTLIAPVLALVLMAAVLWSVVNNFTTLIGGDPVTANWLLLMVPLAFIAGLVLERRNRTAHTLEFTDTAVAAGPAA